MKIEIKKIEKVIKLNEGRLREITNDIEPESTPGKELHRLIHCFMGDLYKLFGDEYFRNMKGPTKERASAGQGSLRDD